MYVIILLCNVKFWYKYLSFVEELDILSNLTYEFIFIENNCNVLKWYHLTLTLFFLQEQNYIAHVMAYSACIGPYKYDCERGGSSTNTSGSDVIKPYLTMLVISLLVITFLRNWFWIKLCVWHLSHTVVNVTIFRYIPRPWT